MQNELKQWTVFCTEFGTGEVRRVNVGLPVWDNTKIRSFQRLSRAGRRNISDYANKYTLLFLIDSYLVQHFLIENTQGERSALNSTKRFQESTE